jgi:peptidoglycan/xylan/chitin deacetylase (PgdA/CDA1 family)
MNNKLKISLFFLFVCIAGMLTSTGYVSGKTLLKTSLNIQKTIKNNNNKKYVYLTFDDGPLNGSEYIDSVVLAEKIKISVFLVGEHVLMSRTMDNYFKYYEENPYIDEYNHSFSHANNHYDQFYSNTDLSVSDILKNNKLLKFSYKIVRLPGRNMWRIDGIKRDDVESGSKTADRLEQLGYKVVGWDLEWEHNSNAGAPPVQSVDEMYNEICRRFESNNTFTPNNLVLLLHDEMFQKKWEESELKQLIDKLRSNKNFEFEQMRFYPR